MLLWIIAANALLTVLYVFAHGRVELRREDGAAVPRIVVHGRPRIWRDNVGMALFFLFLPVLGFVIYYVPRAFRELLGRVGIDREAILTHAFDIDRQPEHPDVREALDVVPVEDALAVSENAERRALLLGQLKKGLKDHYRVILAAQGDEDSESAHYVAAAKMEMYRLLQTRWLECRRDYERDPDDPELYHAAVEVLMAMLESEVLSEREKRAYRGRLCELVQRQIDADESMVTPREYERCLSALVELGYYEEAERLWQEHADRMRSEDAYRDLLKMYYRRGQRRQFEDVLADLRSHRKVRLSPEGLDHLRYWTARLAGKATDE